MKNLTTFTRDTVDVERLAQVIEEEGQPVHINVLARRALQAFFETHGERLYAPGATYVVGEEIRLDGQPAVVRAVRAGSNKKQGIFTVLTLRLADGSERWMAADVAGASVQDREVVSEDRVRQVVNGKDGVRIRAVVGSALDQDARFVWFQDVQGNQWCLTKLLPEVGDAELTKVAGVLPGGLVNGEPHTESTEALVQTVWKIANDGSDTYELAAFALGRALAACGDVVEAGGRWMRSKAWDEFTRREQLTGPRIPTNIELPSGVEKATSGERAGKEDKQVDRDDSLPKVTDVKNDLETWLADHPGAGVFTLTAQHYYRAWLPLSKDIRGLFPPLVAGRQQVTLRLNLVGYQGNLNAWVDLREGRIWGGAGLYEALRAQKVYAGAKLRLLHVAGGVYELATRMVNKAEPVRVWRIWLEDGEVKGEEYQEKRRYDVEDQVFVADARFEDRAALLQQAEEAGNSIFGLMYKRAVIWWEALDRKELRVAVKQLFDDIHFDEKGRMTSPATIAWELWRRLAFEPVGNGLYRFRPEYGEELKPAAVWGVTTAKPPVKESSEERRIVQTRRLPPPPGKGPSVPGEGTGPTAKKPLVESALWDELRGDPEKWEKLKAAVKAYMADPARKGVLFIRGKARECIQALLAEDRLDKLTVEEFNRQVWQIGTVTYRGVTGWVDAPAVRAQLAGVSGEQLTNDYTAKKLVFEGNQTWGSATAIWGAALEEEYRTDAVLLRENLRYLLYSDAAPLETRLGAVVKMSNGFGMNVATGILHVMWPDREMLYNGRSVAALQVLGVTWNEGWRGDTAPYVRYRDFCLRMKEELKFASLTDVDWFMYQFATNTLVPGESVTAQKNSHGTIDWAKYLIEYNQSSGHWAIMPRVVYFTDAGIANIRDSMNLLMQEFVGRVWEPVTKHAYTQRMLEEGIVQPRGPIEDVNDAHARIKDNLLRYLGFAFLESGGLVTEDLFTPAGRAFLAAKGGEAQKKVLEGQVVKLHFWNPVVPRQRYYTFRVRPFAFLLRLLIALNGGPLRADEYNLFVARATEMEHIERVLWRIEEFRKLDYDVRTDLLGKFDRSRQAGRETSLYHEVEQMRKIVFDLYAVSPALRVVYADLWLDDRNYAEALVKTTGISEYVRFEDAAEWERYFGRSGY